VLPAHLFLLWSVRHHRRLLTIALATAAPFVLLLGAALMNQKDGDNIGWIPPLSLLQVRDAGELLLVGRAGLLLLAVVALLAVSGRARLPFDHRFRFLLAWALVPLVATAGISVVQPAFIGRYLLVVVPGALLAVGAVLSSMAGPFRNAALGVGAALTLLFAHGAVAEARRPFWLEDLRSSGSFVAARARPGDAVVYSPVVSRVGILYYLGKEGVELRDLSAAGTAVDADDWVPAQRPTTDICEDVQRVDRLWVMTYGPGPDGVTAAPDGWSPFPEGGAGCVRAHLSSFEVADVGQYDGQLLMTLLVRKRP
jgi:hypothetical protein